MEQLNIFDLMLPPPEIYYQWACSYRYYCKQIKQYYFDDDGNVKSHVHTQKIIDVPKSEYDGDLNIRDAKPCHHCYLHCEYEKKIMKEKKCD